MIPTITLSNGVQIKVAATPFASGGEADLYMIKEPVQFVNQVVKLYRKEKRSKSKEDKLKYLIGNKPNLSSVNGHYAVIWPLDIARINGEFVGYTMPMARGVKLELLCHVNFPKTLHPEWMKFSHQTQGSQKLRLKLCFNIAVALSQVHSIGSYVLVDLKPDNIMVNPNGLISIIDIDSTEIIARNKVLFPAQVSTPEYTPPEYYSKLKNIETALIPETWDRFGLAVIFYRILFGIHPYTGSLKPPHETLSNITDLISRGFLPVGKYKRKFNTIPPPHRVFKNLEKSVQNLFIQAFEDGHKHPDARPSADDWCRALSPYPLPPGVATATAKKVGTFDRVLDIFRLIPLPKSTFFTEVIPRNLIAGAKAFWSWYKKQQFGKRIIHGLKWIDDQLKLTEGLKQLMKKIWKRITTAMEGK